MFTLSVKSTAESPSPAEGFPLCKQTLLCAWNRRGGQHSSAHASNKDPNSCRNNPGFPVGVQTYLLLLGSCLPQGEQSVSLWSQADANRLSPEPVHTADPQVLLPELCRWSASLWIILDKYDQCWIIRAKYVYFSKWNMDVQDLHFQTGFNGLDKTSPALWDCLTTTRSLHRLRGRPHSLLFSDPDIVHADQLGVQFNKLLALRGYRLEQACRLHERRLTSFSLTVGNNGVKFRGQCHSAALNIPQSTQQTRTPKARIKTWFSS